MFAFLDHIAVSLPVWAVYALAFVPLAILIVGFVIVVRDETRQQRWEDFGEGAGVSHNVDYL